MKMLALMVLLAAYPREIAEWRQQYEAGLKAEDGWLTLAGLYWLQPGVNRIDNAPGIRVELSDGRVSVRADGGPRRDLRPDTSDFFAAGRLKLFLIRRGERFAIRVKDNQSDARLYFAGLRWYPVDESWRITARFVPYPAPKKVGLDTVVGVKEEMESPGYVEFTRGGATYRMQPVREGNGLFFVFRDATSGKTTYGAGRFLNTGGPRGGVVELDFNRAVNPPCAFTPYATCPLPPRENRLPVAITAGEMKYPGGAH